MGEHVAANFLKSLRIAGAMIVAGGMSLSMIAGAAVAQETQYVTGSRYEPTIWIDPDGCEHWVMDDGVEGYMTPHVTRDGRPVCHRGDICAVMNSDQLFATDKYNITAEGRRKLEQFFTSAGAASYVISGHTDSRASDAYNMRLSERRANAVARVAQSVGARVASIRAYGERHPVASNSTAAGMAKNRRVEIICLR